ncbi:aminohydrolases N-terminal domain-containing protein [Desulfonema limicola]|uniref:asparagine synthase (glutamine-hydrolyzing) n=1 Tax=Desulfonema limicola TaxID=45656 RepID=A0A975BD50_9BACT|nr:hypothetical protein [Desulfonema limicola]QTA83317.1 aminohydrolases N-terminal domain-containing protein [Desulfonema limicola]
MPGINLIRIEQGIAERKSEIEAVLESLSSTSDNFVSILKETDSCLIGYKAYPEYPGVFWESVQYDFYMEGRIYNQDQKQLSADIEIIADTLFHKNGNIEKLSQWLSGTDGDFLIWIHEKNTGRIIVFNDALGRIPLYYFYKNGMLLISRDIYFITNLSSSRNYERLALAQHLALGHPLGKNTIFTDIFLLSPGTLLDFDPAQAALKEKTVYTFNFSGKKHSRLSPDKNAENLIELFCQACSARTGKSSADILSLSGGFDSRCAGAGLACQKNNFSSISFFKKNYHLKKEIKAAKSLAAIFKSPWQVLEIQEPTCANALKLLKIKNGMNNLGMAFILNFFKQIKDIYGSGITYYTGDGGDMTMPLPDPKPLWAVRSFKSTVNLVLESNYFGNQCFSIDNAAAAAGIKPETIFESVADYLESCPETTWFEKFLHYKFYQRIPKVLVEAEDRNRHYFWTATPFYSIQFFDYAMNCPDEQKVDYALYRRFLKLLSPEAYQVNYSGYNYSPASEKFRIKSLISQIKWLNPSMSKKIKTAVKGVNHSFSPEDNIIKILDQQIKTCSAAAKYMNPEFLNMLISNIEKYEKNQIIELFTLISAMEYLDTGSSSLETRADLILL